MDIFTVYLSQASTYPELSRNAPNLYIFMNSFPDELGIVAAFNNHDGYDWLLDLVQRSCEVGAYPKHNPIHEFGLRSTCSFPVTENA